MKDCKECEYFEGYDMSDGTPICECEGGYEGCPFNDCRDVIKRGVKIEIDTAFMDDYIQHTLINTINGEANRIATAKIKEIVTENLAEEIKATTKQKIAEVVNESVDSFMSGEITIGGGWMEPERKLTRTQYLSETIEKELASKFKSDALKKYASQEVESAINTYSRSLKNEINAGIKQYFNAATREILTTNVVEMLMCNDTYKRLSDSMNTFLPQNTDERK